MLSRTDPDNYTYVDPEQFLGKSEYAEFWKGYRAETLEYFPFFKRYYPYEIYLNSLRKCFENLPGLCHDIMEGTKYFT